MKANIGARRNINTKGMSENNSKYPARGCASLSLKRSSDHPLLKNMSSFSTHFFILSSAFFIK
jgi:hypothetical protein